MAQEKLKIRCTSVDCKNDQHCYSPVKPRNQPRELPSECRSCGKKAPIEWDTLYQRDTSNMDYLVKSLHSEHIRAFFWDYPISHVSKDKVLIHGTAETKKRIKRRVLNSIGSARHFREGQQTPLLEDDDPIHYAQHATGTCCRKCLFYWHGIMEGQDLSAEERVYSERVIWRYLEDKIPELGDTP